LSEASQGYYAFFDGFTGGFQDGIGLAIEGFAAPKDAAKVAHGLTTLRDGTAIPLFENASHVLFGFGAEPNGEAGAEKAVEGAGIGNDAATGGEDESFVGVENGIESLPLHAAIACGTVEIEDDGEGQAGVVFNLFIELNEGNAKNLREQTTERGFAGTAQADQSDSGMARRGISAGKLFEKQFVGVTQLNGRKLF
jgi:hypothetical protein